MITPLLQQLKKRRLELGLKQNDMLMRIGVSRQQYQRLESKGNPRLDTLELIAKGLNSELMLIPKEKVSAVRDILENKGVEQPFDKKSRNQEVEGDNKRLDEDPWQGLLEVGDES